MSRTFPVPHYINTSLARLEAMAKMDDPEEMSMAFVSAANIDTELAAYIIADIGGVVEDSDISDATAYDLGARIPIDRLIRIAPAAKAIYDEVVCTASKVFVDSDAAIRILSIFGAGRAKLTRVRERSLVITEPTAKEAAAIGMIASFGTPIASMDAANKVRSYRYLCDNYPRFADAYDAAESWRLGMTSSKARNHIRNVASGSEEFELDAIRLTEGSWKKRHSKWEAYMFMGISIITFEDEAYIVDNIIRSEIHSVLHSMTQSVLYGANHPNPRAEKCAVEAINYVVSSIESRVRGNCRLDTLGTQMKKSYAVALAMFAASGKKSVDVRQAEALKPLAKAYCEGETPWYEIFALWPEDLAVDIGTVWNLLPGVDADPAKLGYNLREKMEKKKEYSDAAWDDFLSYCAGVISAHIIHKHPTEEFEWVTDVDDPEELEWVIGCRSGTLTYPPDCNKTRITKFFKWDKQLEYWHYGAKDVTHVTADAERYASRLRTMSEKRTDNNELLYALDKGPLLSGKYHPSHVRDSWAKGKPAGDRVYVVAAKRENTKGTDSVRDTESADDISRELISEGEANLRRLSGVLDGVTMGMGRGQLEKAIHRVVSSLKPGTNLISMDYDGWSPNAVRKKHRIFIDLLYSFFDTPYKASSVYDKNLMVLSKNGMYMSWESTDGSPQGFHGTADTILNSLMAQWGFHKAKVAGLFSPSARVSKVSLIDDILIRLDKFKGDVEKASAEIARYAAMLGYKAELVKTLMSTVKGHFLNRVYHNGQEVITACKIFAKADREYERMYTTVWDRVDSIMGSFLGASDRGANPVACYVNAFILAYSVIYKSSRTLDVGSIIVSAVAPFLPRFAGGWGMPSFAQWVTRESARSDVSGLAAVETLARATKDSDPTISNILNNVIVHISEMTPAKRSPTATIDDPFGISLGFTVDPSIPIRRMYKIALKKAIKSPVFKQMISQIDSIDYEDNLSMLLKNCQYPAAILSEFASSLPHSVIRSITVGAERNEAILVHANYALKHKTRNLLTRANARATIAYKETLSGIGIGTHPLMSAAQCMTILHKRARIADGYAFSGAVIPSVHDSLAQAEGIGNIHVHIPGFNKTNMYNRVKNGSIVRTATSRSIVKTSGADGDRSDPVYKAYLKLCAVSVVVSAYGSDATPLVDLWSKCWLDGAKIPVQKGVTSSGTNPIRLSSRVANRNFSVMGWPNAVCAVKVDVSQVINLMETKRLTIPFLGIVYALKASALLDCEIGGTGGVAITRSYVFRNVEGLFDTAEYPRHFAKLDYKPVVSFMTSSEIINMVDKIKNNVIFSEKEEGGFGDLEIQVSAIDVLRSRGVGYLRTLLSRMPGAYADVSKREAALPGQADVPAAVAGKSRRDVAEELAEDSFERSLIPVLFAMTMDDPKPRTVEKVKKLIETSHRALRSAQVHSYMNAYAESNGADDGGLRSVLESGSMPIFKTKSKYYASAAAEYEVRERSETSTAVDRYIAHYKKALMLDWSRAALSNPNMSSVIASTISAFHRAHVAVMKRGGAVPDEIIRKLDDDLVRYFKAEAGKDIMTRGKFKEGVCNILMSYVPASWAHYNELKTAVSVSLNSAEKWMITDFAQEIASRDRVSFMKPPPVAKGVVIPVMASKLSLPDEPEVKVSIPDGADNKELVEEFNMEMGVLSDVLEAEDYAEFKEWVSGRVASADV
jgi:hypothetical protein